MLCFVDPLMPTTAYRACYPMLSLVLLAFVLEISNDPYTAIGQSLIGCPALSHEYCELIVDIGIY